MTAADALWSCLPTRACVKVSMPVGLPGGPASTLSVKDRPPAREQQQQGQSEGSTRAGGQGVPAGAFWVQ